MNKEKTKEENKDEMAVIRIKKETKEKIEKLAKEKGLKHITILEYLLVGKIPLTELV